MKEFYISVEGFDSLNDCYQMEEYIVEETSEERAIKYAKEKFFLEHEDCCEVDLFIDIYSKN